LKIPDILQLCIAPGWYTPRRSGEKLGLGRHTREESLLGTPFWLRSRLVSIAFRTESQTTPTSRLPLVTLHSSYSTMQDPMSAYNGTDLSCNILHPVTYLHVKQPVFVFGADRLGLGLRGFWPFPPTRLVGILEDPSNRS
jgi:hypothetical protein